MKNLNIYIISVSLLLMSIAGSSNETQAQETKEKFFRKHRFVNMTEFGVMFGRTKYLASYGGWYPYSGPSVGVPAIYQVSKQVNVSGQTFNGVYINSKTAAGLTLGVDGYGETLLMPLALGIRRNIHQKREEGSSLMGGLDAGYSTAWLNEDNTGFKTSGGLMISPTVGYRLPMRNGSAWLINFGYRFQKAEYRQERQVDGIYWNELKEDRKYKRLVVRLGIEF
ncbi:hypothetical protein [Emticicia sp. 21SJ11W-3]|uniref:hypothetical protein n=1 Tax=Emticicia sp. 21SJ11W-3 TaxID=2916755 RepID=UPI00209F9929|nr:hypothetical protein [Emticicia sp. 21SJ11W-3]UTA68261.1 hypothetical protein MB380_00270 [Emticicia sp. 21SJ11W-3]